MSQTETVWLHYRRGAFHNSLHGAVRTLQSPLHNSMTSADHLPFKIVGYSLPCERHTQRNEDSFLIEQQTALIPVFDRGGGRVAADIASQASKRARLAGWESAPGHITN